MRNYISLENARGQRPGTTRHFIRWGQKNPWKDVMQKILVSAWVALVVVVIVVSIAAQAQAQESHPMYDNSPLPGQGSHPIYDSAPGGDTHPIYDNTLPPTVSNLTGIGRSINNLQSVVSDLEQTPPDVTGRRDRALREATDALKQLQYLQRSGQ